MKHDGGGEEGRRSYGATAREDTGPVQASVRASDEQREERNLNEGEQKMVYGMSCSHIYRYTQCDLGIHAYRKAAGTKLAMRASSPLHL